jgi:hypothetical protein
MRTFSSIVSLLLLGCLVIFPLSGCKSQTSVQAQNSSQTEQLAVPLIDQEPHGTLETAYFAMG